jgi:hypothetical protein
MRPLPRGIVRRTAASVAATLVMLTSCRPTSFHSSAVATPNARESEARVAIGGHGSYRVQVTHTAGRAHMSENETVETRGDERNELIVADTNNDGKADLWVVDTDGDGKADLFQFDHDGDGKVDLTISDINEDGQPDQVVKGDGGHPA